MQSLGADRLRELIDTITGAIDEGLDGEQVAARAYLSRFHFDRLVASGLGEAPATFRRRLLLERAAWRISGGLNVTDAGIEAGYGSTEAFSRAFSRAFDVSPSRFTRDARDFRIAAPNGIHFHPPAGLRFADPRPGPMGLTERLLEHDHWLTCLLIDQAGTLSDEDLDREVRPGLVILRFAGPEPTARVMLDALVRTKEVWNAAMAGRDFPDETDLSIEGFGRRSHVAGEEFLATARRIVERGEWNDAFIDALCDPPQSFTYGAVFAHVLTYGAHRREVLINALEELGVAMPEGMEPGCPIEWERIREAERAHSANTLRGTTS